MLPSIEHQLWSLIDWQQLKNAIDYLLLNMEELLKKEHLQSFEMQAECFLIYQEI